MFERAKIVVGSFIYGFKRGREVATHCKATGRTVNPCQIAEFVSREYLLKCYKEGKMKHLSQSERDLLNDMLGITRIRQK